MKDLNFQKTILSNNIPLYVMNLPHTQSVAVGVLVKAGTRDEMWPGEAGLAHALEHMSFQGTENFPTSKDVSAYLEEIGGSLNAWTSEGKRIQDSWRNVAGTPDTGRENLRGNEKYH